MPDVDIRTDGAVGCVTLGRPKALNALTAEMAVGIEAALDGWRDDPGITAVMFDALGEKAFCAGGDIADLYAQGVAGNYDFGRAFWRQEYRLNHKIATFPKPIVAFMQGFTMGGGVGLGCHASHRIVCESSRIAMPECGIGLIPDVGGSRILANAPGAAGIYLGLTGTMMKAGDAVYAGFADHYVPFAEWDALKRAIIARGDITPISDRVLPAPGSDIAAVQDEINRIFSLGTVAEIVAALEERETDFAQGALKRLRKGAPLSLACALRVIRDAKDLTLTEALRAEFRFSYRSQERGDFNEGVRAQIIERDFAPNWRHDSFDIADEEVAAMLAPLDDKDWNEVVE